MGKKLLIIDVAALGFDLLRANNIAACGGMEFKPAQSILPAVTCSVQASFRTAARPASHGMVANGVYVRDLRRAMFWEQSAGLVAGPRIWGDFRRRGGTVGLLFWQQSLGENADVVLSPAPIHKHHGGMIQDCYAQPAGLYQRLCEKTGRKFNLMNYWGPMASWKVGEWIADATATLLADQAAPDLCMVYLPTLDYDLQRHPAAHAANTKALAKTMGQLDRMVAAGRARGYDTLVFGDYAIVDTAPGDAAVFPNRQLAKEGLLTTRAVERMQYPDFHVSKAFAMVDHEIAHVYVRDSVDIPAVAAVMKSLPGVADVLDRAAQAAVGLDHANSGELVLLAAQGRWFAYPWWTDKRQAPDYARHIDIHNKPGYDPCELFFGWPPMSVSQNTARTRGSHGRVGVGREIAYASTLDLPPISDVVDLSAAVRDWLI